MFLLGLAPDGGYLAAVLLRTPVVSYTTFSPLLPHLEKAVCFCGPIRQIAPPRVLPGIVLYGVRTFLDPLLDRDHPANLGMVEYTPKGDFRQTTLWFSINPEIENMWVKRDLLNLPPNGF